MLHSLFLDLVSLVLVILALKEKNFDSYRFSGGFQVVCIYWERFRYHISSSTTGNIQQIGDGVLQHINIILIFNLHGFRLHSKVKFEYAKLRLFLFCRLQVVSNFGVLWFRRSLRCTVSKKIGKCRYISLSCVLMIRC